MRNIKSYIFGDNLDMNDNYSFIEGVDFYIYFREMKKMFENCVLVERRNGHKIYEIEKDMQYGIDFCNGGGRTAYSLAEAEQISDEYYELELELENESMFDMATEQDLY